MDRAVPMTQVICLACSGTGWQGHSYVNADLRERFFSYPCSRCSGKGKRLIPLSGKDRAAGEREEM